MAILKINKRWYIDYYPHGAKGKRKREVAGDTKAQAERLLAKRKTEIFEGKFDIQKKCVITFKEMSYIYLENYASIHKKNPQMDKYTLEAHLIPAFGKWLLSDIKSEDIEKYVNKRIKQGMSESTVNKEIGLLKMLYRKAFEWTRTVNYTGPNPTLAIKKLRENNQRDRYLSEEELRRLLYFLPKHIRNVVVIAVNTGLRKSNILNLTKEQIDFDRRVLVLSETKSGYKLVIPFNQHVYDILKPMFHEDNEKMDATNLRRLFNKALKKAKIENFHFHDLRHTFATYLCELGVSPFDIQELLGHRPPRELAMTRRYIHIGVERLRAPVDKLAEKLDNIVKIWYKDSLLTEGTLSQSVVNE